MKPTFCLSRDQFWDLFPAYTYLVIDPLVFNTDIDQYLELDREWGRIVAGSLSEAEALLQRGMRRGIYPTGCVLVEMLSGEEN